MIKRVASENKQMDKYLLDMNQLKPIMGGYGKDLNERVGTAPTLPDEVSGGCRVLPPAY